MTPMLGIMASSISGSKIVTSSFESIATINPSGTPQITFSSIPSTYSSLQLRVNSVGAANMEYIVRPNNDNGSVTPYAWHSFGGSGSTVFVQNGSATTSPYVMKLHNGSTGTYPWVAIIDFMDYASTTKNKTIRSFNGIEENNSALGQIEMSSILWTSTAAISSIRIDVNGGNVATGSSFALYGIK